MRYYYLIFQSLLEKESHDDFKIHSSGLEYEYGLVLEISRSVFYKVVGIVL